MPILVKLSTTLRSAVAGYDPMAGLSLPAETGLTPAGVMARLGIDPAQVKVIMVNGRSVPPETILEDGDRLGLFPAVGGG